MNLPPRKPDESECCGSGCNRCVFDIYDEEIKIWKRGLEQSSGSGPEVLRPDVYSSVKIAAIEKTNPNTFVYTLRSIEDSQALLTLKPGQHVLIKGNFNGESICRQYTPLNCGSKLMELRILIKLYEDGKMSSIIKHWRQNDIIECRGPSGSEVCPVTNNCDTIILVAAGTGITPMVQLIQSILNSEEDTSIVLLFACRTYEEICVKTELDGWSDYWNFSVTYFLSQERLDVVNRKKKYNDKIICRRIKVCDVQAVIGTTEKSNFYAFVCGPLGFEADTKKMLLACGICNDSVVTF